jgi:hypothetical protein
VKSSYLGKVVITYSVDMSLPMKYASAKMQLLRKAKEAPLSMTTNKTFFQFFHHWFTAEHRYGEATDLQVDCRHCRKMKGAA